MMIWLYKEKRLFESKESEHINIILINMAYIINRINKSTIKLKFNSEFISVKKCT